MDRKVVQIVQRISSFLSCWPRYETYPCIRCATVQSALEQLRGYRHWPLRSWKSACNFWVTQDLTTVIPWYLRGIGCTTPPTPLWIPKSSDTQVPCIKWRRTIRTVGRGSPTMVWKYCHQSAVGWIRRCETQGYSGQTVYLLKKICILVDLRSLNLCCSRANCTIMEIRK